MRYSISHFIKDCRTIFFQELNGIIYYNCKTNTQPKITKTLMLCFFSLMFHFTYNSLSTSLFSYLYLVHLTFITMGSKGSSIPKVNDSSQVGLRSLYIILDLQAIFPCTLNLTYGSLVPVKWRQGKEWISNAENGGWVDQEGGLEIK